MESTHILETNNFNETKFYLWNLRMRDIHIDQDVWFALYGTKPTSMKYEAWVVLKKKERRLIKIYLVGSLLLNVCEEKSIITRIISWGICTMLIPWLINILCKISCSF